MNVDFVLQLVLYTVPALIVAALSYLYFSKLLEKQTQRDQFIIKSLSKPTYDTKAAKMQACERLIILAERTSLKNLLLRTNPTSESSTDYQFLLTQHIEQEFEYNVSQQLYVSAELWDIVLQTKATIILYIQSIAKQNNNVDALTLRSILLQESLQIQHKTDIMAKAIKEEATYTLTAK